MSKNKKFKLSLVYLVLCLLLIATFNLQPAEAVYGGINMIDPVNYSMHGGYLYAEKASSSSTYGHHGTDWLAPYGTNVHAAYDGKVIVKQDLGGSSYGKYIIIESDHPDYPNTKFYQLYAHLSDYSQVALNEQVDQNDIIAKSGDSGGVAAHLHYEIRMGTNSWYSQRNPEGLLERSTSDGYGGVFGNLLTSGGSWARYKRIYGATKGTDDRYGASYSYFVMGNGNPFPDENAYGLNYYIGRAVAETVTLDYDNGGASQSATIPANSDRRLTSIYLP